MHRLVADYHIAGQEVQQALLLDDNTAPLAVALQQASTPRFHRSCSLPAAKTAAMCCRVPAQAAPPSAETTVLEWLLCVFPSSVPTGACVAQVMGDAAYLRSAQRLSRRLQARRGTPRSRVRLWCGTL